jgi:hypothetical protein
VFAGFCRDIFGEGSLCFEGATDVSCPDAQAGDLDGVPCDSDLGCAAPYESCAQRTPGAFSRASATQISVFGQSDGRCLGDGLTHDEDLVGVFGVPPTFAPTVDSAYDLPGPGTATIRANAQLTAP